MATLNQLAQAAPTGAVLPVTPKPTPGISPVASDDNPLPPMMTAPIPAAPVVAPKPLTLDDLNKTVTPPPAQPPFVQPPPSPVQPPFVQPPFVQPPPSSVQPAPGNEGVSPNPSLAPTAPAPEPGVPVPVPKLPGSSISPSPSPSSKPSIGWRGYTALALGLAAGGYGLYRVFKRTSPKK